MKVSLEALAIELGITPPNINKLFDDLEVKVLYLMEVGLKLLRHGQC